jgi:hypothetical protein
MEFLSVVFAQCCTSSSGTILPVLQAILHENGPAKKKLGMLESARVKKISRPPSVMKGRE